MEKRESVLRLKKRRKINLRQLRDKEIGNK